MKKTLNLLGSFSVGPLLTALLGLIVVPVTTHFISPEEYGRANMFVLAQGLVFMLITMGMEQAFVREYNEVRDKHRLLRTSMLLPLVVALVLGAVLVIFADGVSGILFGAPGERLAVLLMALMFPMMVVRTFALLKLRMDQRGWLYSAFSVLLKVLVLVLTLVLLLMWQKSFRSVVYALALAEIVEGLALLAFILPGKGCKKAENEPQLLNRLLRYGLPLLPANCLSWTLSSMDQVMLRSMSSYAQLGLYAASNKIVTALSIVQSCFVTVWTPICFKWYEQKKSNDHFRKVMLLVTCGMAALCFVLLLCKDALAWVLGTDFASAMVIFPFLLLHPVMYTMSETTTIGISFARKTEYNLVIAAVSGAVNIALNWLLIPVLGGRGAALATGVSYVCFFWLRTLIARKLWWRFPVWEFAAVTALLLTNCTLHTFLGGWVAYAVSALSAVVSMVAFLCALRRAAGLIND